MKKRICLIMLCFSSTLVWSQNKQKISILNNFDDSLSYCYCGMTMFQNYTTYYHLNFNCKKHINEYLIQNLFDNYGFFEIPSNIDTKAIEISSFTNKLKKKSRFLLDTLKKNGVTYLIAIENEINQSPGLTCDFRGWGIFARFNSSAFYSSLKIKVLSVETGECVGANGFNPYSDFIKCDSIEPKKNKSERMTDDELLKVQQPIMKITDNILDYIIVKLKEKSSR